MFIYVTRLLKGLNDNPWIFLSKLPTSNNLLNPFSAWNNFRIQDLTCQILFSHWNNPIIIMVLDLLNQAFEQRVQSYPENTKHLYKCYTNDLCLLGN